MAGRGAVLHCLGERRAVLAELAPDRRHRGRRVTALELQDVLDGEVARMTRVLRGAARLGDVPAAGSLDQDLGTRDLGSTGRVPASAVVLGRKAREVREARAEDGRGQQRLPEL